MLKFQAYSRRNAKKYLTINLLKKSRHLRSTEIKTDSKECHAKSISFFYKKLGICEKQLLRYLWWIFDLRIWLKINKFVILQEVDAWLKQK